VRNPAAQGRPDANHRKIVDWYEELYCSVVDTHELGFGFPDLVVGCAGRTELVEVKSDPGHLLDSQVLFARTWRGSKVVVVRTHADVINHVQNIRERAAGRMAPTHR
jgi:metal-dependent hydrolase (beta-lactamase superfamily II)